MSASLTTSMRDAFLAKLCMSVTYTSLTSNAKLVLTPPIGPRNHEFPRDSLQKPSTCCNSPAAEKKAQTATLGPIRITTRNDLDSRDSSEVWALHHIEYVMFGLPHTCALSRQDQRFSIGFRSGLYGDQTRVETPTSSSMHVFTIIAVR